MEEQQEQPEYPIRYYELMQKVFEEMDTMTGAEVRGATKVMSIITDYFWDLHFSKKQELDQKAFVKTIDEIRDNLFDMMYHQSAPSQNNESK